MDEEQQTHTNLSKTNAQLIGPYHRVTKNTNIIVKYNDLIIEQVHSAKLFDIHIDSNFTCEEQYNYICKKISQRIWVLKYIRDYAKFDIPKMVHSIIPHGLYIYSLGVDVPMWLIMTECQNYRKDQQELF